MTVPSVANGGRALLPSISTYTVAERLGNVATSSSLAMPCTWMARRAKQSAFGWFSHPQTDDRRTAHTKHISQHSLPSHSSRTSYSPRFRSYAKANSVGSVRMPCIKPARQAPDKDGSGTVGHPGSVRSANLPTEAKYWRSFHYSSLKEQRSHRSPVRCWATDESCVVRCAVAAAHPGQAAGFGDNNDMCWLQ